METNSEVEEARRYISNSKKNIDKYIRKNNYKGAFRLLILVLERLDNKEKEEFIDYYSKNMLSIDSCTCCSYI